MKGQTMNLQEEKLKEQALVISGLREQLRWKAAAVAHQPDQLQFYEEKELLELSERVSRDHYPLKG